MTPEEILDVFNVPHETMKNVYLLGSFARRVTLYSQQVRALNLIYALHKTKKLRKGKRVFVIGAGAAGLTAAAAAAELEASVMLIEQLQGPMELQRNSRIRWIDPFIYDWPLTESAATRANLPVIDWEAGYAERVSEQIEERWRGYVDKIECYWSVRKESLAFRHYDGRTYVYCHGRHNNEYRVFQQDVDVLILAVGFGVEPEHDAQYSYWSDDNLDGSFMTNREGQKWLVSGCGDSGLTDLMRLCIHRFRHGRIIDIFSGAKVIDAVKDELVKAHTQTLPTIATPEKREAYLLTLYNDIKRRYDLFPEYERSQKRSHMPEVYLTGNGPSPYGPNSSILNLLIVCQLQRHGAFHYIPGPAKIASVFSDDTFLKREVEFRGKMKQTFHRVIERHAPQKAIDDPCFEEFKDGLVDLKKRWDALFIAGDHTREKQWEVNYFDRNPNASIDRRERAFEARVREIGIRIRRLSVTKQIDNSGSSTMNYQFEKLSVLTGKLSKLRVSFTSEGGIAGDFKLDPDAERHGIEWIPDKREPAVGTLEERIHCMSRLSGYLKFPTTLIPGSTVTFGFSLKIFSGNALSKWEFYQMYGPDERRHLSGDLGNEIEYLARIIWVPIEILKIKVSLPNRASKPPFLSVFRYNDPEQIPASAVLDEEGVLHMSPASGSRLHPKSEQGRNSWSHLDDPLLTEAGMTTLSNTDAQTWELTVSKPLVGTIYSLDWIPDSPSPDLDNLAEKARKVRARLLEHRQERLAGGLACQRSGSASSSFEAKYGRCFHRSRESPSRSRS